MNRKPSPELEKKQNRYIFCCIGLILYTMPCMSCLLIPSLTEGFTPPMIVANITALCAVAVGLIGMNRFKVKRGRWVVILSAILLMALHAVTAVLAGAWYIILLPELILLFLMILWSGIIGKEC